MDGDNVMAGNVCASSNIVEHVATSVSIIISCLARVVVHDCMEAEVSAQLLVMDCTRLERLLSSLSSSVSALPVALVELPRSVMDNLV